MAHKPKFDNEQIRRKLHPSLTAGMTKPKPRGVPKFLKEDALKNVPSAPAPVFKLAPLPQSEHNKVLKPRRKSKVKSRRKTRK